MMAPRLPSVSGKDTMSALKKAGFMLINVRGSHYYLEPPAGGFLITIPVHGKKTLKPKTLKSILKQANLTIEEFEKPL